MQQHLHLLEPSSEVHARSPACVRAEPFEWERLGSDSRAILLQSPLGEISDKIILLPSRDEQSHIWKRLGSDLGQND